MRQEVTSKDGYIEVHVDDFIDILEQMMRECQALPQYHVKRTLVTPEIVEDYRAHRYAVDNVHSAWVMPGLSFAVICEIRRRLGYISAIDQLRAKDWTWLDV